MSDNCGSQRPIGLIGLGLLGTALCERLLGAGYSVSVYNRSREKARELLAHGAHWSDNPLTDCDRVVVCLYTTEVVEQVLAEMTAGLRPGQTIIDTTTGDPDRTRALGERLAALGVDYLESPIAGSSEQTRRGEAVAMVSGPETSFDASRDLFDCLAAKTFYLGDWGAAAKMKLANNLVLGLNRAVLAEGLLFAKGVGLDQRAALEVFMAGSARSAVMDAKGEKMLTEDFSPQAKLSQHAKDIRLVLLEGQRAGFRLPLSQLHIELLERAESAGWGDLDNSAVIRAVECEMSNSSEPGTSK